MTRGIVFCGLILVLAGAATPALAKKCKRDTQVGQTNPYAIVTTRREAKDSAIAEWELKVVELLGGAWAEYKHAKRKKMKCEGLSCVATARPCKN